MKRLILIINFIGSIFLRLKFSYTFFSWVWSIIVCIKKSSITEIKTRSYVVDKSHGAMSLTDLPELVLDAILERLPPDGLCRMGAVSTSLREKCISDHLWERHMKLKWGVIVGPVAYQEWHRHVMAIRNDLIHVMERKGLLHSTLPVDSILAMYLALENGTFWFPAQIYNRLNGHVGFLLSCYDAKLCYDRRTDTFQARYPAYGSVDIPIEKNVTWERLRASAVDTKPYDLFRSDSLSMLHPGDHLEIQWRRNKELPYGWWHCTVGHLDSCDGNQENCHCTTSDILVLKFNQCSPISRSKKTLISRRNHKEKGNEDTGFYGGIRRPKSPEEISTWVRLCKLQVMDGV